MAKKVKTPPPPPSYFDIAALSAIRSSFGADYDKDSAASNWFKDSASKLEYLISNLINPRIKGPLKITYSENPNERAGRSKPYRLKRYLLRGFSMSESQNIFIKIQFDNLNSANPDFIIEFDRDRKNNSNYDSYLESEEKKVFDYKVPLDETFPDNWEDLAKQISSHIAVMYDELNHVIAANGYYKNGDSNPELNTILYGPPGTGKTFHSITHAVAIIKGYNPEQLINLCSSSIIRSKVKTWYNELVNNGNITFTTFHQSLSYEDFIEGIKPLEPTPKQPMQYDIIDGVFKNLCTDAKLCQGSLGSNLDSFEDAMGKMESEWNKDAKIKFELTREGLYFTITEFRSKNIPFKKFSGSTAHSLSRNTLKELYLGIRTNPPSGLSSYYNSILKKLKSYSITEFENEGSKLENPCKYVLIIDEINRGNVSQIFGELITLLEPDKRIGQKEEIQVLLPYSKEEFGVPSNVYIIGTMNTADRSVEALDTALRRRFSFIPMMPKTNHLKQKPDGICMESMLKVINERLKILKDNNHTIGHAWLWDVDTFEKLRQVFNDKIIPLLQEFFYNDYEKLGLLLGDQFVELDLKADRDLFAEFPSGNGLKSQYLNKCAYKFTDPTTWSSDTFKSIYRSSKIEE